MLELINLTLPLEAGLKDRQDEVIKKAVKKLFKQDASLIDTTRLRRLSVDARKKSHITFIASLAITSKHEQRLLDLGIKNLRPLDEKIYRPKAIQSSGPKDPIVVIGAGCAGIFAGLALAEAGLCPIILERGAASHKRTQDIKDFNASGILNSESNIQFGLGGAGTFSDGKLTTNTNSPFHSYVKQSFVNAGAPQEILWRAKPHIGSDLLPDIVQNIAHKIEKLGGKLLYNSKFVAFEEISSEQLLVHYEHDGRDLELKTSRMILATGHSARDTFEYLYKQGLTMERKKFAMGVRIEHLQHDINASQYGRFAGHPALGAADYKLVAHISKEDSAYTFCMCPGGEVVNASSEQGLLCTNGMSNFARDGLNANAGFLVGIDPKDLAGSSPLAGIELQRDLERKAFIAGDGGYRAPVQLLGDFLHKQSGASPHKVKPSFPQGYTRCNLDTILPDKISNTLRKAIPLMAKKLHGFDDPEAVLTAVETRSSSPLRILRDSENLCSISHPRIIPCGEGAGYAGGIMSAAADGVRCAQSIISLFA